MDVYAELARNMVVEGQSLFITGKAGTGKTTLLKTITADLKRRGKNVVVLSPTGVAAINAGGVTIHSFLHLPLSIYLPGMKVTGLYSLDTNERELIKAIDTIIIDEVSMVRCDLIDMVDDVLRHYRGNKNPFGGIQIVFFGDMYQLMPVATKEDREALLEKYKSIYFFSSRVYEKLNCSMIELKHIYRQESIDFIDLLDHVRRGSVTLPDMRMIKNRYMASIPDKGNVIRLTTHNRLARNYNNKMLDGLDSELYEYKAKIDGYYSAEDMPADYILRLKKGARVMFVKNDTSTQRYINGTLGKVMRLSDNIITVKKDDGECIDVERASWDRMRYHINKVTKSIDVEVCATFRQFPLRQAWAVTIHKSQGMTFDNVVIDAGKAFTYGQVYVALSRCRTFHGISLASDITEKVIKTDPVVVEFMRNANIIDVDDEVRNEEENHFDEDNQAMKRTLWMAEDGLSIDDMVVQSGERAEIIYSHISKLVGAGKLSASKFISNKKYKIISAAIAKSGSSATIRDIKSQCPDDVKYGEISIVLADIKRQGKEKPEEAVVDDDWHFVPSVKVFLKSSPFLSYKCIFATSTSGYYMKVIDEYIKLGDYPSEATKTGDYLWVLQPRDTDIRLVHEYNGIMHLVGYVREEPGRIIFTMPDGEEKEITFG